MALAVLAIAYSSAEAQEKRYKVVEKEVCTTSPDRKTETCYKNVYHYTNDVYEGKEPTEIVIKKNKVIEEEELQYCEKSPRSNIVVCYNTKSNTESSPTFYKMCRDDEGYGMYCTPYIPTNSTYPYSKL